MTAKTRAAGKDSVWALIPARYASSRFPGKPLAMIAGKPMIQHVYERAIQAPSFDRVIIATDDADIAEAVRNFGGTVVMTGEHPTGTDRIAEAVEKEIAEHGKPGWVMNVQGDEPLINPDDLELLIRKMLPVKDGVFGTLIYPIKEESEMQDTNVVKVVMDKFNRALYFSRAPIPFPKEPGPWGWRSIHMYLYRTDFLFTFARLQLAPNSVRESLEPVRALEHGYPIHCFEASSSTLAVDVPEAIEMVEKLLS